MAPKDSSPSLSSSCLHAQQWRDVYQAMLNETDTFALFKCVEVAEAAVLTRRSALRRVSDQVERREIEEALDNIRTLKRERLRFDDGSRTERSHQTLQEAGEASPETE